MITGLKKSAGVSKLASFLRGIPYTVCSQKKNERTISCSFVFVLCAFEVSRVHNADIELNFLPGLSYNQIGNNLTSQAATLDTHGLPNDVLGNLNPLSLVIFIPIRDL